MRRYALVRTSCHANRNEYVMWIYNCGVDNSGRVIPDFLQWTDNLEAAKLWKKRDFVENIAGKHKDITVVAVESIRRLA